MKPILFAILVVWLLALLVWTASQSVFVPAVASSVVTLGMFWPWHSSMTRRTWVIALVTLSSLLLVARLAWPYGVDRSDGVLPVTLTLLVAECLLLVQAFVVLTQREDGSLPRYLPSLGLFTLLCAFNQRIIPSEQPRYLALALAVAFGCAALASAIAMPNRSPRGSRRRGLVLLVLCFSALGAWGISSGLSATVPRVHQMLPLWMARSDAFNNAHRGYVRSGTLTSIITEQQTEPMRVALRVYASHVPGYLRGLVYDSYHHAAFDARGYSQWQLSELRETWSVIRPADSLPPGLPRSRNQHRTFTIKPDPRQPFTKVEVHNDPTRGKMFFTPLETSVVAGKGDFVAIDYHHVVHGGFKVVEPYTAYSPRDAGPDSLSELLRDRLLTVPDGLDPEVGVLADQVCGRAETSQQKIDTVVAFFRENFEYATEDVELPANVEPLSYFLLNRIPAHCEYFASGAAMLLRHQGIPCRYVTGYVVSEPQGEEYNCWIARNRNAHAWVEAYDQSRQRWVLVEATPGMTLEEDSRTAGGGPGGFGDNGGAEDDANDDADRGWLTGDWWSRLQFLAVVCGCVLVAAFYRLRFRSRLQSAQRRLVKMHGMLALIDRRLQRRNFVRGPSETLHAFARRLREAAGEDKQLHRCADWYLQYAEFRYAGEGATPAVRLSKLPL